MRIMLVLVLCCCVTNYHNSSHTSGVGTQLSWVHCSWSQQAASTCFPGLKLHLGVPGGDLFPNSLELLKELECLSD